MKNNEEELFYDPDMFAECDENEVVETGAGIEVTWGDAKEAFRRLAENKGCNGPFSYEEFHESLHDVVVGDSIKSLVKKGYMESVLKRDNTVEYRLTEEGKRAAESQINDSP